MWPWEHLAFGYVIYSGYTHLRHGRAPDHRPIIALVVATQFPDLVDKPLAWSLGVLPTARSLGHSLLFAVPVLTLINHVAKRRGSLAVSFAVIVGYGSHLLGDVIYGVVRGGTIEIDYFFWPLMGAQYRETTGVYLRTTELLTEFVSFLGSPSGLTYLVIEIAAIGGVFFLWIADGRPGLTLSQR